MKITAWRVIKKKHRQTAFKGDGARIYGGRWNPVGTSVVYTAESLSLATLEIVVHLEREELLYTHFLKIPVTFDVQMVTTLSRKTLPRDWSRLPPSESTQKIGYKWISQSKFAVLKVPSTIIMEEYNYLINPNHPDFTNMQIGKAPTIQVQSSIIRPTIEDRSKSNPES